MEKGNKSRYRERVNEEIRVREVLLIDHNGQKVGIVSREHAIDLAREVELDLVEVSPRAKPPVCKIMDYGKFRYERSKKEHQAAKRQHQVKVKEIRLSAKISDHDLEVKIRNAREMLINGDRVEFILRFKGREITHSAIGKDLLIKAKDSLSDISIVDSDMQSMGKIIRLSLAPDRKAVEKIRQKRRDEQSARISSKKSKRTTKSGRKSEKVKEIQESEQEESGEESERHDLESELEDSESEQPEDKQTEEESKEKE